MQWTDFLVLMKQELAMATIIAVLLIAKVAGTDATDETRSKQNASIQFLVNGLLVLTLVLGFTGTESGNLFADMYRTSPLILLQKNILTLGTLLISLLSGNWLSTHKHLTEFYVLLLSTLLGMFLMISSANLLMFYLGLELSTIPLAALVNFDLDKRRSSEAAMKMIISSAFSSALLLLGVSFLYGSAGTLSFDLLPALMNGSDLQLFSFVLILAGFGFKISAVPFHLWTADVYEGAPVPVTAFLSVISKGAVLFIFLTVLYQVFGPLQQAWYVMLFLLSVFTLVTGNLFALRQQNLKRMLAFSSITQVGFILVGISASGETGASSVVYFVLVYIFSNLSAFGVVGVVSALTGKETIDDFKGFYKNNKFLSWVITIGLFALAGVPPTAGFFGKFFLLLAGASKGNFLLLTIAALNMVVALYYYLRVVKAIFMDENEQPIEPLRISLTTRVALILCMAGVLLAGIYSPVYSFIDQLVKGM